MKVYRVLVYTGSEKWLKNTLLSPTAGVPAMGKSDFGGQIQSWVEPVVQEWIAATQVPDAVAQEAITRAEDELGGAE